MIGYILALLFGLSIWLFGAVGFNTVIDHHNVYSEIARFAVLLLGSVWVWFGLVGLVERFNLFKHIGDFFHGLYRRAHAKIHGYPYVAHTRVTVSGPSGYIGAISPDDEARAHGAALKEAATRARMTRFQSAIMAVIIDGRRYEVGEWIEIALPPPMPHEGIVLGEIIAYRCWRLPRKANDGKLLSVAMGHVWEPRTAQTMQREPDSEGIQEREDGNGFHAFKNLAMALNYLSGGNSPQADPMVVGEVTLWGNVIEHRLGYRAEFAYPRAFHAVATWEGPTMTAADQGQRIALEQKTLRELTERYGLKR